ncbi:MAG: GerMN domain-containing protein [Acidobacteriia bacterium]|nr:GerMN domain-containing protein [Terriglobia bacterium]
MIPRHLMIAAAVMIVIALAMGLYAWHIRGAGGTETASLNSQPVAPPVSGPTEQVTLYVAYDDPGVLRPRAARIPLPAGRQERAQELLRALLNIYLDPSSPHPLAAGSEIRDVYLVEPGLAVIDLNPVLADNHRSGVLVEELTMASLVQTLSANVPGLTRAKILVDGKERDTLAGHLDLTAFFDVSAINQLVLQLQSVP